MKIVAKKGFEIDVQVSGFQGRGMSEIKVSFSFGGKIVKNENASLVRNGKIVEGISLPRLNGYVECEVSQIEKALESLPVFVKMYEKVERDSDGIPYTTWIRNDGFGVSGFMKSFLEANYKEAVSVEEADGQYEAQGVGVKKSNVKLENIMFDNESEGVDRFNGIEVDPMALVGIETVTEKKLTPHTVMAVRENVQVKNVQIQKGDKFYYITDGFAAIVAKRFYTEQRALRYARKHYGLAAEAKEQNSNIPDGLCDVMEAE